MTEVTTYTAHDKHERGTSMSSVGFEPANPEIKQLMTYTLDHWKWLTYTGLS
jgi:hypothetical protein